MARPVARTTLRTMENVPRPAEELAVLDRELAQIESRRAQLLARKSYLLTLLTPPVPPVPPVPWTAARTPETSPPSVQNALLALGGVLLTIAAIAFTVVSWGAMGIGGRSVVLGTVTAAALAAPAVLPRRGLTSTAEAVGALALVLTVLDAYALHRVALAGTDPLGYTAAACAVLATGWAAYGLLLGRLRTPLPAAVLTAQLPLPLWALAADASLVTLAWALLVTAVADTAIALWAKPAPARSIAGVTAWVTGGSALLIAGGLSVTADSRSTPPGPACRCSPGPVSVCSPPSAFPASRSPVRRWPVWPRSPRPAVWCGPRSRSAGPSSGICCAARPC